MLLKLAICESLDWLVLLNCQYFNNLGVLGDAVCAEKTFIALILCSFSLKIIEATLSFLTKLHNLPLGITPHCTH